MNLIPATSILFGAISGVGAQSLRGIPTGLEHRRVRGDVSPPNQHVFQLTVREYEDGSLKYNGNSQQASPPEIRVQQGDAVKIVFHNQSSRPLTTHLHGIAGNNKADGSPVTQLPVEPNSDFKQEFIAANCGTHWFHSHVHAADTLFRGAYGALIVECPEEATLKEAGKLPDHEEVLILADTTYDDQGKILDVEDSREIQVMNGVEGDALIVNGQPVNPDGEPTPYQVDVETGTPMMLRIINTSIARYWRLALSTPGAPLIIVGGEGGLSKKSFIQDGVVMGMQMDMPPIECSDDSDCDGESQFDCMVPMGMCGEQAMINLGHDAEEVVLAPGGRVNVVVNPGEEDFSLMWKDFDRGVHTMAMTNTMCTSNDDCSDGNTCMLMKQGTEMRKCGMMIHGSFSARDPIEVVKFKVTGQALDEKEYVAGTPLALVLVEDLWADDVHVDQVWKDGDHGGHGGGGDHGGEHGGRSLEMDDMCGEGGGGGHGEHGGRRLHMHNMPVMCPRINLQEMMGADGVMLSIDDVPWRPDDTGPSQASPASARKAHLGQVIEFEIHNHSNMHHPFHLHGFSFQPSYFVKMHHGMGRMERYGYVGEDIVDTVDIPDHTSMFARVRIEDIAGNGGAIGRWLFHCHIIQHAERGMTSELIVMDHMM